jgi:uncharacterized OB-fold protein
MCGGHFVRMLVPVVTGSVEQAPRSPEMNAVIRYVPCPACGAATTPEFTWCPKCGTALKTHPCAYCGQTISPGDKTCVFCGAPANKR